MITEWKTGLTLSTSDTKRWSKEQIEANDKIEARMVFENFSIADQGRSRKLICVCSTPEQAALVCVRYNSLIAELNKK